MTWIRSLCKSKKGADEIRSFDLSWKKNFFYTSKASKNKMKERKKDAYHGQRLIDVAFITS